MQDCDKTRDQLLEELIRAAQPDIVVLDVRMENWSGIG
jgi:CheY-like chemotaxis protein